MHRPLGGLRRRGWRGLATVLVAGVGLLTAGFGEARAAEPEVRDFEVLVDGKHAGDSHTAISRTDDGMLVLSAQSNVQVKVLLLPAYTYSYRGHEVWKDGRLMAFACDGKDNGRPFAVSASAQGNALRVQANGKEHAARPDVWTTSCWQLPPAPFRNQVVPLLRCDKGLESSGLLQYVGADRLRVAGQDVTCAHYRLARDVPHDLWYDGAERLVREEWNADGHRVQIVLTNLRH